MKKTVYYSEFGAIGDGVATIENCKIYQPERSGWYPLFELRSDYSST